MHSDPPTIVLRETEISLVGGNALTSQLLLAGSRFGRMAKRGGKNCSRSWIEAERTPVDVLPSQDPVLVNISGFHQDQASDDTGGDRLARTLLIPTYRRSHCDACHL